MYTGQNGKGERFPGARFYCLCLECGKHWRHEVNSPLEPCSDEEWLEHAMPDPLPRATTHR